MKKLFKLFTFASVIILSTNSFAAKSDADNDYDSNYYATEGSIIFKIRGSAIMSKAKNKSLPTPTSVRATPPNKPQSPGHMLSNGYGIEGATAVFFGDNIAAELGLGLNLYKTSSVGIQAIAFNYNPTATPPKHRNIYAVPLSLLLQYHIAPFGAIRPYLGAGYQGTYFLSKAKEFKLGIGHGYALQVGVDFVLRDDTMLNFDMKYHSSQPKITYKIAPVTTKLKINPIIISAGIGFKF